jgi:Cyclin, C-terminal domain.
MTLFLIQSYAKHNYLIPCITVKRFSQDEESIIINPRSLGNDMSHVGRVRTPARVLDVYALACLGIAIKLFSPLSGCPRRARKSRLVDYREENGPVPSFTSYYNGINNYSLVELGGGLISAIDIANVELLILETLSYRLHPPTSYAFITNILRLVPFDKECIAVMDSIFEFAKYQAELASLNAKALRYQPSLISVAAICNAIHHHLSLLLPSHDLQASRLSNLLDYDSTKHLHLLVSRMEEALKVSLEFDTRITSLRKLLSYLMYGGQSSARRNKNTHVNFEISTTNRQPSGHSHLQKKAKKVLCHNDVRPETTTTTSTATPNQHYSSSNIQTNESVCSLPRKRNKSDHSTFVSDGEWETPDCFLNLAFDALLPDRSTCPGTAGVSITSQSGKWVKDKKDQMNSDLIEYYNRYIKPQLYKQEHQNSSSLSKATSTHEPVSVRSGTLSTVPSSDRCSC